MPGLAPGYARGLAVSVALGLAPRSQASSRAWPEKIFHKYKFLIKVEVSATSVREKRPGAFAAPISRRPFSCRGSYPFRVWGYGTTDALEDVLARDYFRSAGGLMHPGDLIYVAVRPPSAAASGPVSLRVQRQWAEAAGPGQMRMALVMVKGGENGAPSVRLVQDFGCPDDPDAPLAAAPAPTTVAAVPPRRGRGRPSGSRTRKKEGAAAG